MTAPSIIEAVNDPAIWRPHFRDRATWAPWFTAVKALFGLPLDNSELDLFRECTGRMAAPNTPAKECFYIVGRRGGKSRVLAVIAAYLSAFVDWQPFLVAGERGVISVIATDRRQCRTIMNYLRAFLVETPLLDELVTRDSEEEILLANGILIEVVTCSFKAVRGRTIIAALCDEAAFWASEDGSNPASEVFAALRPAMATIPRALMLVASSPYSRRGPLFDAWQRYWAKDGRILVWRAPTWTMNPNLSRESEVIAEAFADDPTAANAEFGAEWRDDVGVYIDPSVVAAATVAGRAELAPTAGQYYVGFADAAGGSGQDSFTAAVCHLDRATNHVVLDAIREIAPPFSPEQTVGTLALFFKSYRIRKISADRWGGQFPVEAFAKGGIQCEVSELTKSQLYLEMTPLLNSGRLKLLDHPRLTKQLCALERRTARGGRDSIDHPPGGHDDIVNSVAGAAVLAGTAKAPMMISADVLARARQPGPSRAQLNGRYGKPPCFF